MTGPAETVVQLVVALKRLGLEALFACGQVRGDGRPSLLQFASSCAIQPVTDFILRKHFDVVSSIRDAPKLAEFIREERIDIIHTHLLGDHVVGAWASQQAGCGIVVRSVHSLGRLFMRLRARILTGNLTHGLILHSRYHQRLARHIWPLPTERTLLLPPPVALERFRNVGRSLRERFGFREDDVVAAIVGRIQRRRRVTLFLEALARAREKLPYLKGLVIGRGTKRKSLVEEPIRRLGLEDSVVVGGYFEGDEYPAALASCDFGVYLAPGTDETAKALRELMALGKPVIAGRVGMLPELVEGRGVVVGLNAGDLAEAMVRLGRDGEVRERFGEEAARFARERMRVGEYARRVALFYERLLAMRA